MLTGGGVVMVIEAAADLVPSACEVAVTVMVFGLGAVTGAVYNPLVDTVPHADPLQPGPVTVQVTAVLLVCVTIAVNCCVALMLKVAKVGEMATVTGGGVLMVTLAEPAFELSA